MTQGPAKIRLFVGENLAEGAGVALSPEQARHLFTVLRLAPGDAVLVFNGRDGEWLAEVAGADRRGGTLCCRRQTRPQAGAADLWLVFAPLKKARTDYLVEKAVELGCRRLVPVFSRFTSAERVRTDRLQAHAIGAAEQCGRLEVPEIAGPQALDALLAGWDPARRLMFCDERGGGAPAADLLAAADGGPWAVLVGPEGGFAADEAARIAALPFSRAVSLGPRILRADTAALAALTLWQAALGDWR